MGRFIRAMQPGNADRRCASSSFALTRYGGQVAFIQDKHSINDIMKAQGIPDFFIRRSLGVVGQAPPPIPKFIDAQEAIDELPSYDSFEPPPDQF